MDGIQSNQKGGRNVNREEKLIQGIENLGLHVEPGLDTSAQGEYVVVLYSSKGVLWGDDAPTLDARDWEMVYVCPLSYNRLDIRKALRQLVFDVFDVWPSEEDVTDGSGQRFLYVFGSIEGLGNG